jgi:CRISPR system Cascade subunit CasC
MKALVELHILQSFAPSNLNRDDTGAPKDAIFGGARRARISSQCLKRAARKFMEAEQVIDPEHLAIRTKRVTQELARRLELEGRDEKLVGRVAEVALGGAGFTVEAGKTQYLFYLSRSELDAMAETINGHWNELTSVLDGQGSGGQSSKKRKQEEKERVPQGVRETLDQCLAKARAVDLALFGRMLADRPSYNQDAACQVAHAISTHKVELEYDFYTAVDDLKPMDNAGADMIGTVEFNSATYYRYVALDLQKLVSNLHNDKDLQNDLELALRGLRAFLRACVLAEPTGKQNGFAAHNPPAYVAATVRTGAVPRSLANAFEKPVRANSDGGLLSESISVLEREWSTLEHAYGGSGKNYVLRLAGTGEPNFFATLVSSLDELVSAVEGEARSAIASASDVKAQPA